MTPADNASDVPRMSCRGCARGPLGKGGGLRAVDRPAPMEMPIAAGMFGWSHPITSDRSVAFMTVLLCALRVNATAVGGRLFASLHVALVYYSRDVFSINLLFGSTGGVHAIGLLGVRSTGTGPALPTSCPHSTYNSTHTIKTTHTPGTLREEITLSNSAFFSMPSCSRLRERRLATGETSADEQLGEPCSPS